MERRAKTRNKEVDQEVALAKAMEIASHSFSHK